MAAVALIGSGALVAAPMTPAPPEFHRAAPVVAAPVVELTATSLANIPMNLFYAIANIPANLIYGLNTWADAIEAGGSWWLKTPTNVWGWDPANPAMIQAAANVLMPFPVISGNGGLPDGITPNGLGRSEAGPSEPITAQNSILGGKAQPGTLGYILNVLAAAELPMHPACGFVCYDILTGLEGFFTVPLSELAAGYTFPADIINPNDPTGEYAPAWEGQTAAPIDFAEPFVNFVKSLMEEPPKSGAIKPVTLADIVNVVRRLDESATIAFNPWYHGSYLLTGFPLYGLNHLFDGLIKGVIARICPICGIKPDVPPVTSVPAREDSTRTVTLDVPDTTAHPGPRSAGARTTSPAPHPHRTGGHTASEPAEESGTPDGGVVDTTETPPQTAPSRFSDTREPRPVRVRSATTPTAEQPADNSAGTDSGDSPRTTRTQDHRASVRGDDGRGKPNNDRHNNDRHNNDRHNDDRHNDE